MNKDIIKGKWTQMKGQVQQKWGKLTDNDLKTINGQREELVGKLQERYGHTKDRAEHEVDNFFKS